VTTDVSFHVTPPKNGKTHQSAIDVFRDQEKKDKLFGHRANIDGIEGRRKASREIAGRLLKYKLKVDVANVEDRLEEELTKERKRIEKEKQDAPSPASPASPASQRGYQEKDKRICYVYDTKDGEQVKPLCNFVARIIREEVLDDGSGETRHLFIVQGTLASGKHLDAVSVPADSFAAMNWPMKHWGLAPVVFAGWGVKDHLRVALQVLSVGAERCHVYTHTGWTQSGGVWKYLHGGGAIGPDGTDHSVHIDLGTKLSPFTLPDPPAGDELRRVVKEDLDLLTVAPKFLYPLLGAVYRSVLGLVDCSISLIGPTGLGKSEVAALVQQHFGPAMDRFHLPGNWSSTANSLESLAFLAKDALLTIDDFNPSASRHEADQLYSKADRVLRAQGNHSGRALDPWGGVPCRSRIVANSSRKLAEACWPPCSAPASPPNSASPPKTTGRARPRPPPASPACPSSSSKHPPRTFCPPSTPS
jgi:Domain of unknown function (DUF927)